MGVKEQKPRREAGLGLLERLEKCLEQRKNAFHNLSTVRVGAALGEFSPELR